MRPLIERLKRLGILFKFDNSAQLLANRLLWPDRGPVAYEIGDLEIFIDHSTGDQDGTRSCLVPGLYEPCLTVITDLPKTVTVLDLGSNGGGFLLFLRKQGFSIGQAVGVELNPHTWSRLILNIYRNIPHAPSRVTLLNGAAGKTDGSIVVRLGRGSVGDSILAAAYEGETYELPQYSFNNLVKRFPEEIDIDLCKIDIEGAEYDLLRDTGNTDLRRCRHIIMEIHDIAGESCEALRNLILSHGFKEISPLQKMVEDNVFIFSRINRS